MESIFKDSDSFQSDLDFFSENLYCKNNQTLNETAATNPFLVLDKDYNGSTGDSWKIADYDDNLLSNMNRNIADFSKGFIPEIDLTPKEELQLSSFAEVGIETPNKTFDHKDIDLVASKEDKQAENHEASFTYKDSTLKTNSRDKPFKAQFADRRDVIYKTLIRSVRRFLWDDFSSTLPDVTFSNMTRGCSVFEDFLKRFYQEQFCVENIHSQKGSNEFAHLQLLSVFMTQYYLIPKRSATSKKIAQALKQI